MENLTTTEIKNLLGSSPQRINAMLKEMDLQPESLPRAGLKKSFSPNIVKDLMSKKGINFNESRIMAFCNNKGGVGKTSMAINSAMMLSNLGMKVLLIDNDPQANSTSFLLNNTHEAKKCLYHVVTNECSVKDAIVKINSHLDLIPANLHNSHLERFFQTNSFNPSIYYKKLFANLDYNFIIWDLSPALSTSNTFALMSCDSIQIVTDLSDFGYQGVEMTISSIKASQEQFSDFNPDIQILVNMFDERKIKSLEYIPKLKDLCEINPTIIKVDSSVTTAQMQKTAIPSKSKIYKETLELVCSFIGVNYPIENKH